MKNSFENYPIINLNHLSNEQVLQFFQEFGFVLVKDTVFGEVKMQQYFKNLKIFFTQIREQKVNTYSLFDSLYGAYLPLGMEHVSHELFDFKEVFDYFHKDSYTYEYYSFKKNSYSQQMEHFFLNKDLLEIKDGTFYILDILINIFSESMQKLNFGLIKKNNYLFRMIHYPPISNKPLNTTRLGSHIDDDLFALVMAENTNGLRIKTPAYSWIEIPNITDVFIVLIGGGLEFITEGLIKGTEHKVDCDEKSSQSRYVFNINIGSDLDFVKQSKFKKNETLKVSEYYKKIFSKYSLN